LKRLRPFQGNGSNPYNLAGQKGESEAYYGAEDDGHYAADGFLSKDEIYEYNYTC
jgi:hypothetical protein